MSFLIGRYNFEGPMINWRGVSQAAGIYAILSFANSDFELVDIGESENLQEELLKTENLRYWQSKSNGMLTFSVYYYPKASRGRRQELVHEILREFDCEDFYTSSQRHLPALPALV